MFNRQLTVGVTKTPRASKIVGDDALPNPYLDPETMLPIVKDLVLDGAKLATAIYAGARILNTACEIAKIAAKAKF
jgi:hypothetical protein